MSRRKEVVFKGIDIFSGQDKSELLRELLISIIWRWIMSRQEILQFVREREEARLRPSKIVLLKFRQMLMLQTLRLILAIFPLVSKDSIIKLITWYASFFSGKPVWKIQALPEFLATSSFGDLAFRLSRLVSRKALEGVAIAFLLEGLIVREEKRLQAQLHGGAVPYSLLISPTARCNLRCRGCYAANYSVRDELPYELVDRVVSEAEDLGVALVTMLGGEPFIWPPLLDLISQHPHMYFLVFTNATLINEQRVARLKDLGNVMLILSVEGFEQETDARRGAGTFAKVMAAMNLLRGAKIPFGYSVTATRMNEPVIASDAFVDFMIAKGALMGWMFLCMPVGGNPDLELLPTAEQRVHMLAFVNWVRETRPIFMIDFWNDAPYVGGCIAGKYYAHINPQGCVEPCIFTHFCQDNIKDKSLKEVMNSEFFRELRRSQPYNDNLYLPCMWIDNPEVSRELYARFRLMPCHPGAEEILEREELKRGIDNYCAAVREAYRHIWEQEKFDMESFYKLKESVLRLFAA